MLNILLGNLSTKNKKIIEIYYQIHHYGPMTKAQLIQNTKIKQTTVTRSVNELLNGGLISEQGYDISSGGRPPILYGINSLTNFIIGIDISRTYTTIVLVDLSFNVIDRSTIAMTKSHDPHTTINHIKQYIKDLMGKFKFTSKQLLGIGIGAVGPIDRKKGMILEPDNFLAPGWVDVKMVRQLESTFHVPVILENGANTAALAEYYISSNPKNNMLYCISGVGLRCGVLTNGELLKTNPGDASSFGQMIIHLEQDSKPRPLSSLISFKTILTEVKRRIIKGEKSIITNLIDSIDEMGLEHLFIALNKKDQVCQDVVLQSAYYYGIGILNMIHILHPEHIILSGRLIHSYPPYYEKIIMTIKEHIGHTKNRHISFGKGSVKDHPIAVGASVLVVYSLIYKKHLHT